MSLTPSITASPTSAPTASPVATATATARPLPTSPAIAFQVEIGIDGVDGKYICTVNPDGSDFRSLEPAAGETAALPAWSATREQIYFEAENPDELSEWDGPSSHLFVMDADGTNIVQLTTGPVYDADPAVSPDGDWIAYAHQVADDRWAMFLMRLDGSDAHQLVELPDGESDRFPSFSPDATQIAFDRGGAIYIVGVDGEGLSRVTPDSVDAQRPRWSPDGQRLVFEANGAVQVIGVDGDGLDNLGIGGSPDWSPDGNWITYQRYRPGTNYFALVVAGADGSHPIEIWTTPPGTDTFVVYPAWSH